MEWANQKLIEVVKQLGPGDRILVIDIGPGMKPEEHIQVECTLPSASLDLMAPPATLLEWRAKQNKLRNIWESAESKKRAITVYLSNPIKVLPGGTDVPGSISYAARRLKEDELSAKYLIILSDLRTERGGLRTDGPPANAPALNGVTVTAAFVPWVNETEWYSKEAAWADWFEHKALARSFHMSDPGESRTLTLIPRSDVPYLIRSPFVAARD